MKKLDLKLKKEEIEAMVSEMDYVGNGKINYTEFLAAILSVKSTLTDEMLWRLFKTFDVDNTDSISELNLLEAFERLGHKVSVEEVGEMIAAHDLHNDGRISFDEFKKMFEGQKKPTVAECDPFYDEGESDI